MSIEQDLKDLTAAVKDLTEAFIAHTNDAKPSQGKAAAKPESKKEGSTVVAGSAPEGKATGADKATSAKKPIIKASEVEAKLAEEEAAEAAQQPTIPYSDIQTLIKANVATKRPAITAVLDRYKIKMATELKPEQYKQFFDELTAELGAEADLA